MVLLHSPKILMTMLKALQKKIRYNQKESWDNIALKYMSESKSILDIGCGEGRFIEKDSKRIIGIDRNENSIDICLNKGLNVQVGIVTELPFKNQSFDAVHCSHVIEHLYPDEAHKLLSEMNRVLKTGGIFCIRTPLLYSHFYDDFSHIKPYNPEAILHYIQIKDRGQNTLQRIDGKYEKIKLKYRNRQLFKSISNTSFKRFEFFFNLFYRFGIGSLKKTGYMLVLRKIK